METRELHEAKVRAEEQVDIGANEEGGQEYTRVWICDVCKTEQFEDYDEAVAHEEKCQGLKEGGQAPSAGNKAAGSNINSTSNTNHNAHESIQLYPEQHPQLCLQRLKLGHCPDCGRHTYEVDPITGIHQCLTNANVLQGRCLICHPLPAHYVGTAPANVVAPDG